MKLGEENKISFPRVKTIKVKEIEWDKKQLFQVIQDLDRYTKYHIGDANAAFLREKLRFLLKILPIGKAKTATRGLLAYFSRWTKIKTWRKIVDLIKYLSESIIGKSSLDSNQLH